MTKHTFPIFVRCRECDAVHALTCHEELGGAAMGCAKCCGGALDVITREEALKEPWIAEAIENLDRQAVEFQEDDVTAPED